MRTGDGTPMLRQLPAPLHGTICPDRSLTGMASEIVTMSRPNALSDLLNAFEAALQALEDDQFRAPHSRLVPLLARRRRSVMVLRSYLRTAGPSRHPPRRPHLNFEELIATEFRLARMVDVHLFTAPQASALSGILCEVRAEVDEAALSLRLIAQTRL